MPNHERFHEVARLFARMTQLGPDRRHDCFEEFVDCFLPRLLAWFRWRVRAELPNLDPSDLTQDCLLTILRKLASLNLSSEGELVNWVYAVALNTLRGKRRELGADSRRRIRVDHDADPDEQASTDETEDFLQREQQRTDIDAALGRLTPEHREVFLLHLEGLPHDVLAHRLGINRNTFDLRLSRAKQRLRGLLPDHDPAREGEDTTP